MTVSGQGLFGQLSTARMRKRMTDLTDAVSLLNFLFLSGPPSPLGTDCVRVAGCPERCIP